MPPPDTPRHRAAATRRTADFAVTLTDGRRVVGRTLDDRWYVHVYASDGGRLLGYGTAPTRPQALHQAGLTSDDTGETLGRAGS